MSVTDVLSLLGGADIDAAVLARVERRLHAAGAYEALWRLERMSGDERALLIAREVAAS